eukprot:scaffold745_cov113-Isochrysis_galbana.AAC.3
MAAPGARPRSAPLAVHLGVPAHEPPVVFAECSNCSKSILNANLALHEAHCFRLYERCSRCGASIKRGSIEAHRGDGTCQEVSKAGGHVRRLQSLRQTSSSRSAETIG